MSAERIDTAWLIVAGTPNDVFSAFVDPEALTMWLPPSDMTGRALEYDFREGGRYRIELAYASDAAEATGKTTARTDITTGRFLVVEPGKRLIQTVEFESDDVSFAGEMTMTWTFEPTADGTRVSITAENVPPGISKADHDAGLRSSLENLAEFCRHRHA